MLRAVLGRPVGFGFARAFVATDPNYPRPERVCAKPTFQDAKEMPREYHEFSNDVLMSLAAANDTKAQRERMIREVMFVDEVDWDVADKKVNEMRAANQQGMLLGTFPYRIGVTTAIVFGFGSIPLCFDLNTVAWFNDNFVTTDVPPPEDLETWLEVGSWSWNWMEPPLGQLSFFLLCLQYARTQLDNIGVRPYNGWLRRKRAKRLQRLYPMYDKKIVEDFSRNIILRAAK